jgi:formate hydrogenlyase subunit 3/multisubunit Na+/H+ antiporter MnhD subunit
MRAVSGAALDATELASELLELAKELAELLEIATELLATELLEAAKELLAAELMVVGGGVELPPPPPQATRIELRATRLKYLVVLEFGILGFCTVVFCIGASSVSTPAFAQLLLIADDY